MPPKKRTPQSPRPSSSSSSSSSGASRTGAGSSRSHSNASRRGHSSSTRLEQQSGESKIEAIGYEVLVHYRWGIEHRLVVHLDTHTALCSQARTIVRDDAELRVGPLSLQRDVIHKDHLTLAARFDVLDTARFPLRLDVVLSLQVGGGCWFIGWQSARLRVEKLRD